MEKTHKTFTAIGVVTFCILSLVAFIGCQSPIEERGEIQLNLDDSIKERTLLPDKPMNVTDFQVVGTGPTPFDVTVSESTTIDALIPGTYDVTVTGLNTNGDAIGEGSQTGIEVIIGQTAQANITVTEYSSPDGSMSGLVTWQPDVVASPVVTGYLKDSAGTQTDLSYTLGTLQASTSVDPLGVGYYTLVTRIIDDTVLSTGFAEVLRVVAGENTDWQVDLTANQGDGQLDINIGLEMHDPLQLTFDQAPGSFYMQPTETKTITLTDVDEAGYIATWYLNGEQQVVDQDSFTLDGSLLSMLNTYQVSCVVFSTDGSRAGSAQWSVQVVEVPPEQVAGQIDWQSGSSGQYRVVCMSEAMGILHRTDWTPVPASGSVVDYEIPTAETDGYSSVHVQMEVDTDGTTSTAEYMFYGGGVENNFVALPHDGTYQDGFNFVINY